MIVFKNMNRVLLSTYMPLTGRVLEQILIELFGMNS
jgi:hypothetical protein